MGWMVIWWVLGIGALAALLSAFTRGTFRPGSAPDSPELILKRRYAKGEIDHDAYERMLADVRK